MDEAIRVNERDIVALFYKMTDAHETWCWFAEQSSRLALEAFIQELCNTLHGMMVDREIAGDTYGRDLLDTIHAQVEAMALRPIVVDLTDEQKAEMPAWEARKDAT